MNRFLKTCFRILCLFSLLAVLMAALPSVLAASPAESPHWSSFTLADLGEKDLVVKSIYDQVLVHFPLAEGVKIEHAVLLLHFSHGPKLLPEISEMTIALNDEPVATLPLTADNANETKLAVELPPEALLPRDNKLRFHFRLRMQDKGCGDMGDPDLWVKVFADSSIELAGSELSAQPDLGYFPAPYNTLSLLPGSPALTLVVPSRPNAAELTVAARIAAVLGQSAQWESPPLWMFTADAIAPQRAGSDHLIVVDSAGRNPFAAGVAPGLTERVSPYNPNRLMLVVSGPDEKILLQSAELLSTQSARSQLSGTHISPKPVTAQPYIEPAQPATLAELGFLNRRVSGIGDHDLYYPLDIPYNWKITNEAAIELHFTHAIDLAKPSRMRAYINGFQVANVALNNRNDINGRLLIQLSPRQIHPGRNWLHLAFDLHLHGEDCMFRYLDEAWAEVSADNSQLNLAHVISLPPLDLRYLPSPLVTPIDLSADWFVLPAQVGPAELTAMARLAAKLGAYSNADRLLINAVTAGQFTPRQASNSIHVIAIGSPETNSLLAEYDSALPQPLLRVNGTVELPAWRELLPEEQNGLAGYLQLLPAPWKGDATLVVISAQSSYLLYRVVDILPVKGQLLKNQGSLAVITPDHIFGMSVGNLVGGPLSMPARLVISTILIGSFVSFGAIGMVSLRRRQEANRKDE